MNTYTLSFRGDWKNDQRNCFPEFPGLFCAYRASYNLECEKWSANQLLFIGESANPRHAVSDPDLNGRLQRHLKGGEELVYTYAPLQKERIRIQAAMVYFHKPIENFDFKYFFPYEFTNIVVNGRNHLLHSQLSVPDEVEFLDAA